MMSRLSIRHRDTGRRVPFVLRPQQQKIMAKCKDHMAKGRRLYVIFLKARRVGISTWASGIQLSHIAARPDSHAAIIAQVKETSKELFTQASGFSGNLRPVNPALTVVNNKIIYPHQGDLDSDLRHYTAATVHGTRGLTFSSIHMTEAAFYPYDGAYTAILNTLSSDPDNICIIETTANGMEGPGQAFYEYWTSAIEGDSEFLPIFLPWWDDPAYVRDPEEAEDAPANDYEKWLMNDVVDIETGQKAPIDKSRIAWFRLTLADKCEGNLDRWRAEYPACVVANTRVSTNLGIIRIADAENATRTETGEVCRWGPQPVSAIWRMTTRRGRVLEGTVDHPVMTGMRGFQQIGHLQIGEKIKLSPPMFASEEYRHMWHPVPGIDASVTIDDKWALLLGYFMGDGCWYHGAMDICCDAKDQDVVQEVGWLCDQKFGYHSLKQIVRIKGRKGCTVVKTGGGGSGKMNPMSMLHAFRELGLLNTAEGKNWDTRKVCVPDCIWKSPKRIVAHFIAGLFESDAHAGKDKIEFGTCHRDFARDIQLLLLGFGINSTISCSYKHSGSGRKYVQYKVRLNLVEAVKFAFQIGFRSLRKKTQQYHAPLRDLQVYRESECLEDTVESVEYLYDDITYDFNIKDVHCFGANGILTHNTPEEAFIATGNPAFTQEETQFAQSHKCDPLHYGRIDIDPITRKPSFTPYSQPVEDAILIWDFPQARHHYFFGVDTARGEMNKNPGDFAAIVGWDAETGEMVCRYMGRVSPESLAETANLIGRFYNDACLNVEVNNLGYVVMRDLRDRYHYPTQYRWRGRDDKYDGKSATALGFETTDRYRRMMFNVFRTSLYRKETMPKDKVFIQQMLGAKMEMGWRWEIAVGHDDVFMAGLLGWIAKEQYHPMRCQGVRSRNLMLSSEELAAAQIAMTGRASNADLAATWKVDPTTTAFGALMQNANDHLRMLEKYAKAKSNPNRLNGI